MECIYAAMLLHKAGKKIEEASVKKILDAAGIKVEEARVKALVSTLEGVNIDEAVKKAAMPIAAPAAGAPKAEKKAEEKKKPEEEKKTQEAAAAGLGALFG